MYKGKRVLAIVPIRSNSKTIKNLNIYPIYNKPLFLYTTDEVNKSKYVDTMCISTDSMKYALLAEQNGLVVPFIRPCELATDDSKLIETIVHARDYYRRVGNKYDCIVTLMANAPLKSADDIDKAIEMYFDSGEKSIVSITDCNIIPQLIRTIDNGKLNNIINMSSTYNKYLLNKYYRVNECLYVNSFDNIDCRVSLNDNILGYYMPFERSVVIKTLEDVRYVRHTIKGKMVSDYIRIKKEGEEYVKKQK